MKFSSMKNKFIKKSNKSLLKTKKSKKVKRKTSQRKTSQRKPTQRKTSQRKPTQRKTQRKYLKKGGGCCCGKNNFSAGAPYNPNEWGTQYNRTQTYYPFNNEVINPPIPANQSGGNIIPSVLINGARGIVENAKGAWNTFHGVQSPYSSYVSPVIQPALEYENNNSFNKAVPVPVDIKMIHDSVGSMV